jgi:hypothetical protein
MPCFPYRFAQPLPDYLAGSDVMKMLVTFVKSSGANLSQMPPLKPKPE